MSASTPAGSSSTGQRPRTARVTRAADQRLTAVTRRRSPATRTSSRLASGTRPTATSTPWVKPTQGTPVARVSRPASSPSGKAAPKQITSGRTSLARATVRRRTSGTGSIVLPGWRTTRNGWAASKAAAPGQAGAYTTTRSAGSRLTRLWQYCWIPPDRGGKSLVTSSRFTARAF